MTSDRHIALRLLAQAAIPLAVLVGIAMTSPMGFGQGGPIASALMICLGAGLYALVFGFAALADAIPGWLIWVVITASVWAMLACVLAQPEDMAAWARQFGLSDEDKPAAFAAQVFGSAAMIAILGAGLVMLQAIGGRAQPLLLEDGA